MQIKFLGHAGFLVETNDIILLIDAWCNPFGAFDGGWFQLPCNHQVINDITYTFSTSTKPKYVYISHEHKDHFDKYTLQKIEKYKFTYIIPFFNRNILHKEIQNLSQNEIKLLHNEQVIQIGKTTLTIFIDDAELNRDSAILVQSGNHTFLNLNDCKIHDRLNYIKQKYHTINTLAAQYSGATWHPTCYDYTKEEYARISKNKVSCKFESIAKAIEILKPQLYIPSAGPACFLDEKLIHLNFQEINIFPKEDKIKFFLDKRLKNKETTIAIMYPADEINDRGIIHQKFNQTFYQQHFEEYIHIYAKNMQPLFEKRKNSIQDLDILISKLKQEFELKLSKFTSRNSIDRNLYIQINELVENLICINFKLNKVTIIEKIVEAEYYKLSASSIDFARVLNKHMTWEDFSLSFRMQLNRAPDIYQVLMQGFLILEKEDMERFCAYITLLQSKTERIQVEVGGNIYSIQRFCPHQGSDLTYAKIEDDKYIVCPRHHWKFDMEKGGICHENSACIHAIAFSE